MPKIKNIPILGKILAIVGFLGVFVVSVVVFSSSEMSLIDQGYSTSYEHEVSSAIAITRANRRLVGTRAAIAELLIADTDEGNAKALSKLDAAKKGFSEYLAKAVETDPSQTAKIGDLTRKVADVVDVKCALSIELGAKANDPKAILASQQEFLKNCSPAFDPIEKELSDFSNATYTSSDARVVSLKDKTRQTIMTTYVAVGLGLLVALLCSVFAVSRYITSPLRKLAGNMERLARKDFDVVLESTENHDEIGLMARAVAVFKMQGEQLILADKEAEKNRLLTDEERAAVAARRAATAAKQEEVVTNLGDGLLQLAEGNLTFRFDAPLP